MLNKIARRMKDFRTVTALFSIGEKEYVWLISKPGTTEKQNQGIEDALKNWCELNFGRRELAFVTKVHCGIGCNTKKKSGAKLFVVIPPDCYNEGRRLKGLSSTFEKLLQWKGLNAKKNNKK